MVALIAREREKERERERKREREREILNISHVPHGAIKSALHVIIVSLK